MEQYILKSSVVEEIEKRIKKYATIDVGDSGELDALYGAKCKALMEILSFLDTIEIKEVDLEKEIKNRIDSLSNLYCYMEDLFNGNEEEGVYPIPEKVINELFEFAKHFFEFGLNSSTIINLNENKVL